MPPKQIRHKGSGRKDVLKTNGDIEKIFLNVIEGYIAGDPMDENIRWLKLTRAEISEKMRDYGVKISRNIVRKLMKKHKFVKRKMQRKKALGKAPIVKNNSKILLLKKKNS